MTKMARIGVDTSKSVFQLHGVDEADQVVVRRQLRRGKFLAFFARLEPTSVGLEACSGSHYWVRELRKPGHAAVPVPPQYVKPYVARGKNDAADAEAICEAMSRPRIQRRLVPVKTAEQAAAQMLMGVLATVEAKLMAWHRGNELRKMPRGPFGIRVAQTILASGSARTQRPDIRSQSPWPTPTSNNLLQTGGRPHTGPLRLRESKKPLNNSLIVASS